MGDSVAGVVGVSEEGRPPAAAASAARRVDGPTACRRRRRRSAAAGGGRSVTDSELGELGSEPSDDERTGSDRHRRSADIHHDNDTPI